MLKGVKNGLSLNDINFVTNKIYIKCQINYIKKIYINQKYFTC